MNDNDVYKPLKVQERVLEIVEECFIKENNGDTDARRVALDELETFLIKTGDGSYTLKSEGSKQDSETMHTHHGGLVESLEKYVKPSHITGMDDVHVLDICSGLGYTAAVCIEYLMDETKNPVKNPGICIEMVEISPLTLATGLIIPSPLESHEIVKKAIEDKLYSTGFLKFRLIDTEIPENIELNLHLSDAREIIKKKKLPVGNGQNSTNTAIRSQNISHDYCSDKYDAVFLAPFSPGVAPELYTLEFLTGIKSMLKNEGRLLTYTSSAAVRYAMIYSGLHVGEGPSFGRSGGTIASPSLLNIEKPLSTSDERMIALTDAGIPFRDPELDASSGEITEIRQNERSYARKEYKFASTVQSPVYLCNDIEESRLRRRVLKDFRKLGFEGPVSGKSRYLVCPQYQECICKNECENLGSSRERVLEMEKRLNKIIDHHLCF